MAGQAMYKSEYERDEKILNLFDLEELRKDPNVVITYSISDYDLVELYKKCSLFRDIMGSGYYCRIEDRICLYTPKLINSGKDTDTFYYDEQIFSAPEQYCLTFVYRKPDTQNDVRYSKDLSKFMREEKKLMYSSMVFVCPEYEKTLQEQGINSKEFYKELQDTLPRTYIGSPPSGPPTNPLEDLIKQQIKIQHTSLKRLSLMLKISEETIERFWTKPESRPKLENVIAVCLGLHMPPTTSDLIILLAGYNLRNIPQERGYRALINGYYNYNITICNRLLIVNGLDAMTRAV